jgi:hypothetical protein
MRRLLAPFLLLAALALAPHAALAQAAQEHEVKAAFLFRFLSFVDWPAQALPAANAPIAVGILGSDEVAAELRRVVPGRTVNGRPVEVRALKAGDSIAGLHVLFVGRGESGRLAQLARQASPGLMLVSEAEGALDQGSVINFVATDGRIRFEIALDAAQRQGLRISSRMLSVAQYVRPAKP